MSCRQVIIKPILSHDDERLARNGQPASLWIDALKSLCPKPIDWLLLELVTRLDVNYPPYIDLLADKYGDDGMPPHCLNVEGWVRMMEDE